MNDLIKKANEIVKFHKEVNKELKELYRSNSNGCHLFRDNYLIEHHDIKNHTHINLFANCNEKISYMVVNNLELYNTTLSRFSMSENNITRVYNLKYTLKDDKKFLVCNQCQFNRDSNYVLIGNEKYETDKNIQSDMLFQMSLMYNEFDIISYIVLCEFKKLDQKIIPNNYSFDIIHDETFRTYFNNKCLQTIERNKFKIYEMG